MLIENNPRSEMRIFDGKTKEPLFLTPAEINRFLHSAAALYKDRPQYYALCYLYASTGMRVSEALPLTFADFNLSDEDYSTVRVGTLKQHNPITGERYERFRTTPLTKKTRAVLLKHTLWDSNPTMYSRLMFPRTLGDNEQLNRSYVSTLIKDAMIQAGIPKTAKRCCAKALRHGFAMNQLAEGNNTIWQVQSWMGHSSARTTSIYTQACGPTERRLLERGTDASLPDIVDL